LALATFPHGAFAQELFVGSFESIPERRTAEAKRLDYGQR